jgi:fluoroacetyl-CoA thioesterase
MIGSDSGRRAKLSRIVTWQDTAAAWGEVFPPAASTPFVVGLAEITCHAVIAESVPQDSLTVGTSVTITHLAPSAIGAELVAHANLVRQTGSRLTFAVTVYDGDRLIARVDHERAIVRKAKIEAALKQAATGLVQEAGGNERRELG